MSLFAVMQRQKQGFFWYIFYTKLLQLLVMLNVTSAQTEIKATASFLLNSKPSAPANSRQPLAEKRVSDPSAFLPGGRSYPIPAFFHYRSRPKELDQL